MERSVRGVFRVAYCNGIRLKDCGKPRKTSVRIAGLRSEIWTRDIPNTKQECYQIGSDVRFHQEADCNTFLRNAGNHLQDNMASQIETTQFTLIQCFTNTFRCRIREQ
jgi:hypothetical protein